MARYLTWAVALAATAAAALALARYPGSAAIFLLFNLCFFACVALLLPQPRLYVYTFLALLLGLGLWGKTIVHTIWDVPFLEPIGDFSNKPEEWDRALLAMSAAATGMLVARAAHLWFARRRRRSDVPPVPPAPRWFARYRAALWTAALVALVAVNWANLHFAFFQIGVNPKLLLPLRLHILVAWLVNIGFALLIAAFVWWDYRSKPQSVGCALLAPLVEALLSATSAFSRIAYLVHALPYGFALWERRRQWRGALGVRWLALLAGAFVVLFTAAIVAVFALRLQYYPLIDRVTGAQGTASIEKNLAREVPQLMVRRWVGLEGVLTAGSVAGRGSELLFAALTDSAKRAGDSLYQRAAKLMPYRTDPSQFTFLTNAGPVAILLFSGSLIVVALGMALIVLVLALTEEAARALTGNPFLLAVAGAALANVVSQTTYFYLTAIFLLQLWLALALVAAAERLRVH